MFTLIGQSGIFGQLLLLMIIVAIVYFIISVVGLVKFKKENFAKVDDNINNILRVGIFSAPLGFLGTIQGGYEAITAIIKASDISMAIVYQGLLCALASTILGFYIFAATAIVWFILRNICKKLNQ